MAFEQVFKNIDNALRTDEGCSSELDYVEQSSWILFLKYLDDLDKENEMAALLGGGTYSPILDEEYRWNTWAMPRNAAGEYDIHNAMVGDDLIEFVNGKLFPYLKNLGQGETDNTSIKVKIGLIFAELRNKLVSGYCLRDIIEQIDGLKFQTSEQKHEMTYLYESRLNKMGNAGRNGGEYYTPRPLIRSIVKVVNPTAIQGQIEGGVLMSMGYALTEDFPLKDGVPQAKFGTLGLLRANQIPDIHAIYVEKDELLPVAYGAKGIGEIAAIPTAPAVQGAYYALDGVFRTSLPLEKTFYRK